MSLPLLSAAALRRALALRDLSDPAQGPHAMQRLVADAVAALTDAWGCPARVVRQPPLVSAAENYDALGYPPDGAAREARYSRYVRPDLLLRTHTSAALPPLLSALGPQDPADLLLACPGLVYRRDAIDRTHVGEPHQLDLWRIRRGGPLGVDDLEAMVAAVVAATLPGRRHRTAPARHPYTRDGLQVDIEHGADWLEVGECGRADPGLLARCGLPPQASGLAMGLGLDRLLMLRKGIDDIRLLRSDDPRVAEQLLDLAPYRPVSAQPAIARDLSIAVAAGWTEEELGDAVRDALGVAADAVEQVAIVDRAPASALPPAAAARLGIAPEQENLLLRVILRHPTRTLTRAEANQLRDQLYAAVHRGSRATWATGTKPGGVQGLPWDTK